MDRFQLPILDNFHLAFTISSASLKYLLENRRWVTQVHHIAHVEKEDFATIGLNIVMASQVASRVINRYLFNLLLGPEIVRPDNVASRVINRYLFNVRKCRRNI